MARVEKTKRERIEYVRSICNDGENFNFHIIPLLCFDSDHYTRFSLHNDYNQCYIKKLYINGKIITEIDISDTINLSLKPGVYSIKVLVNIRHDSIGAPSFHLERTFEVNNVRIDQSSEAFLALTIEVQKKIREYYDQYKVSQRKVKEEFVEWCQKTDFGFVTKESLKKAVPLWDLHPLNITPKTIQDLQ